MGKKKPPAVVKSQPAKGLPLSFRVALVAAVVAIVAAFVLSPSSRNAAVAAADVPAGWGPCHLGHDTITLHVNGGLRTGSANESALVRLGDVASFEQVLRAARGLVHPVDARDAVLIQKRGFADALPKGRALALHARDGRRIESLDALRALVRDAADVTPGPGCATAAHVSAVPEGDRWFMPLFEVGAAHTVRLRAGRADEHYASVTTLGTHPRVFRVDNFLSAEECERLKAAAAPALEASKTYGGSQPTAPSVRSGIRQSSTAWLGHSRGLAMNDLAPVDDFTTMLQRRAAELTGMDPERYAPAADSAWRRELDEAARWQKAINFTSNSAALDKNRAEIWGLHQEMVQVVRYEGGSGFYKMHLDPHAEAVADIPKKVSDMRVLTLLVYLTDATDDDAAAAAPDDEDGGAEGGGGGVVGGTYFPLAYERPEDRQRGDDALAAAGGDFVALGLNFSTNCSGSANPPAGGRVYRPRQKGTALLFYSMDISYHSVGVVDWRSTHGGCTAAAGPDKWISNFWFHTQAETEYANMPLATN